MNARYVSWEMSEDMSNDKNDKFVILTGTSGSGKSVAMNALEDIGFYCVDNLPVSLLTSFAAVRAETGSMKRAAVAVDCRGAQFEQLEQELAALRRANIKVEILFLDAADHVLATRFKQTRRRHPLETGNRTLSSAVATERRRLTGLKEEATYYIDTTEMSPAQLKERVSALFVELSETINVCVESFGFKHGIPADADLVFDVRCLPNPYWIPQLRDHTGLEKEVRDYVYEGGDTAGFVARLFDMMDYLLPLYRKEGKSQLIIAIGCTGGHHRSVAVAEDLYRHLKENGSRVSVLHRDISK